MNKFDKLDILYFEWLSDLVNVRTHDRDYSLLLRDLHRKQFRWFVPNDNNRAYEGKNLRERFCDESNFKYIYEDFPEEVSILEVLIAIAYRCDEIMIDHPIDRVMHDWFWMMIENIGLIDYDNVLYNTIGHEAIVDVEEILDVVNNRTYRRNGKGGLFPLKYDKKDQRKVELWYQMNTYLVENYYSDDVVI